MVTLNETTDGLSLDDIKDAKDVQDNLELTWIAIAIPGSSLNRGLFYTVFLLVFVKGAILVFCRSGCLIHWWRSKKRDKDLKWLSYNTIVVIASKDVDTVSMTTMDRYTNP